MENLGLLAGQDPLLGWLNHRFDRDAWTWMSHGAVYLVLVTTSEPTPRLAGRAKRDPIEPVTQLVGVADRSSLASQDEEDGLEGVLGVVVIQELAADVHDHGPVSRHQGGEGGFAGGVAAIVEPVDELAIGQPDDGAAVEQRPDLPNHRCCCHRRHAVRPLTLKLTRPAHSTSLHPTPDTAPLPTIFSQVVLETGIFSEVL